MSNLENFFPERIICLTEEPTETLYLLGEEDRIIGISGFTMRPKRARKEKPKVAAFTTANIEAIVELQPDLVIGFSDIQAEIASALIAKGVPVWINNHRSVVGIFNMMVQIGSMVGKTQEAIALVKQYRADLQELGASNQSKSRKPSVYFEEWDDPMISGIQWVSELIELAGGIDIFNELKHESLAKDRIIADPAEVVRRNPDIIIASWCGKKFKKSAMLKRENWHQIKAVKNDHIFEIKSELILQPGPAAVTDGVKQIIGFIEQWHGAQEQKEAINTN
ncbi:MAG: cobalamin-binding protein [Bacteroidota bacterium]